jgi:hypothetical protein
MLGIQLMFVAGIFVAISNLFFRKGVDAGGTSKGYLMIQLGVIFLVAILLNPVRTGDYHWSPSMAAFGLAGGIVLAAMLAFLGKAVETGPSGLTFAILNSSTVMPMVLMCLLFGCKFGFIYKLWNGIGSVIVLLGLFWAGWDAMRSGKKTLWLTFALLAFALHVIFLVFMQWRALFINYPGENGLFLSFDVQDAISQWFMPMIFLAAAAIQTLIYAMSIKRLPNKKEFLFGVLGGITNGVGTYFMIWSTEVSTPFEHAMIFPIFAITVIICSNLWSQRLYKERINWFANALCVLGILIGTLDWQVLLG